MRCLLLLVLPAVAALVLAQDDPKPAPPKKPAKRAVGAIAGTLKNRWLRRERALLHVGAVEGRKFPPPKQPAAMDQENLVFKPHVLAVLKGTTVRFPNSDSVRHNVYSPKSSAKAFNLGTYDAGVTKEVVFDKPGVVPLLCNVHAEMSAYIIVTETPFFAWTERNGAFRIEGVLAGKRTLHLWHERFKSQTITIEVKAGQEVVATFAKLKKR